MNRLRRSGGHRTGSQRSGYRSVPPTPDGAISPGPMAAGRFLGRGTEACVLRATTAAEALTPPVMVSPTCICPLVSPAKAMDEVIRQRTKADLHIFLLLRAINRPILQHWCAGMGRFCLPFDMAVAARPKSSIIDANRATCAAAASFDGGAISLSYGRRNRRGELTYFLGLSGAYSRLTAGILRRARPSANAFPGDRDWRSPS